MRILSFNCNGIRSADRKGFFTWLADADADVVCLQEIRAQIHQLADHLLAPPGFAAYFFPAERPGYSGTAIYSRHRPLAVRRGLGFSLADSEGRFLQLDFPGISIASVYLPSGSSGDAAQARKFAFMREFDAFLATLARRRRQFVLCGDWNIAHRPIDLKNWHANAGHSGFLPEERAWLDKLFDEYRLVDAFRVVDQRPERYTWWSNRGQARARNVGWRIDYQIVTPGLASAVRRADIHTTQGFSDHAPLTIEYDFPLSARKREGRPKIGIRSAAGR